MRQAIVYLFHGKKRICQEPTNEEPESISKSSSVFPSFPVKFEGNV